MTSLSEIMSYNQAFVEEKKYEEFATTKFPNKRIVILTCMDTRLIELLPKAMNLKNGDAKIIKSAGAIITHPFGGLMRSILVAVYELQADEVYVIGHHDCGMSSIDTSHVVDSMIERGIDPAIFKTLEYSGIDMEAWLHGFSDVTESVKKSVDAIKNHPLIPEDVNVHGLVIDPANGKLDVIENGYDVVEKA
ncbi:MULTISPECIES: beta-class carbonic anhydrase [Sporosarcina]|uniref:carbonic anhydrase n=2 Tax=Sporosarcina newyorkensis TaxID=759851 RepID=A0A1T4YSL4_9BACL|nr:MULTISPECIES: carbonic anhydrase [Sporosarcina]EGQ26165.1 carbonate dehydratase [Sporosarcina newyorkensis 2681]MBY0223065.1 carbonic anhydrase [Sporosarcina aquimarina]SKB04245.1 carbonic anhydrase [Sporosarcina newyorkensis]